MSEKKSKSLNGWLGEDRRKRREEKKRDAALRKLGAFVLEQIALNRVDGKQIGRHQWEARLSDAAGSLGLLPEVERK